MIDFLYLDDYEPVVVPSTKDCDLKAADPTENGSRGQDVEEDNPPGDASEKHLPPACAYDIAGSSGNGLLLMHAKMYALGSKYDISPLQAAALEKFEKVAKHDLDKDDLAAAIGIVFGSTPESDTGLRSLLMQVLLDNLHNLLNHAIFVNSIDNTDGLVLQLLKEQTYRRFTKRIACRVCGTSKARPCNGSSSRNRHSYVTCDCDEDNDGCCGSCSRHW